MNLNRREWLLGSFTAGSFAEIAAAREHTRQAATGGAAPRFEYFDEATAADVEAIAAEILPSGGGPGAKETGVVYFIDRALHTFERDSNGGEDGTLRDPAQFVRAKDCDRCARPRNGRRVFRRAEERVAAKGESGGGLRERSRIGQTAAAFEVQSVSERTREFERLGGQEPDVGQRLVRERAV
jgi:hypothetical protein